MENTNDHVINQKKGLRKKHLSLSSMIRRVVLVRDLKLINIAFVKVLPKKR